MWYHYNHIRYKVKIYLTFVNTKHVLAAFYLQQYFRQYAGCDYQKLLSSYGMICSMSRKGDCWNNAVNEFEKNLMSANVV